ncbi:putative rad21/Rec8-like protein [Helianthus annuus]|nr:putative rad21/Rec8-like protein [Helianthus annuus]
MTHIVFLKKKKKTKSWITFFPKMAPFSSPSPQFPPIFNPNSLTPTPNSHKTHLCHSTKNPILKMFYSHNLLARKGPLGTVWCAAHLQNRLKKPNYISVNIPLNCWSVLYSFLLF